MEVDEGSDQKLRLLAPLDGCACAFEELSLRKTKSTIISWAGSILFLLCMQNNFVLHVFTLFVQNVNIVVVSSAAMMVCIYSNPYWLKKAMALAMAKGEIF